MQSYGLILIFISIQVTYLLDFYHSAGRFEQEGVGSGMFVIGNLIIAYCIFLLPVSQGYKVPILCF